MCSKLKYAQIIPFWGMPHSHTHHLETSAT
jgi:hypothetical protein